MRTPVFPAHRRQQVEVAQLSTSTCDQLLACIQTPCNLVVGVIMNDLCRLQHRKDPLNSDNQFNFPLSRCNWDLTWVLPWKPPSPNTPGTAFKRPPLHTCPQLTLDIYRTFTVASCLSIQSNKRFNKWTSLFTSCLGYFPSAGRLKAQLC